ncbi:NACHT domain-containing protein [Halotia wernerae UHCC 0503]|nr:NACHT domain-containing protein [Halotia wernerae UHCC 0503]
MQVDDVYVPLGLVERNKQSKRQGDFSPEQGSELYKETEITKTYEHGAFLNEVLKQQNTPKSKGKRIAIIGEPGAGKTTLLQQIADWVSREIDQSIVIWVSLADLREKKLKSYLFETWLTQVAEKTGKAEATKQLKDDFVALFNQNNVWLYRAYFLAAAGIAEFRDYSRADEIVAQIVKWAFGNEEWVNFLDPIKEEAKSVLQQTDRTKAIAALVQLVNSTDVHYDTCWEVAESLGLIGTGNEKAIVALLHLLNSTDID